VADSLQEPAHANSSNFTLTLGVCHV